MFKLLSIYVSLYACKFQCLVDIVHFASYISPSPSLRGRRRRPLQTKARRKKFICFSILFVVLIIIAIIIYYQFK